jgi:hypothetical protein
MSEELQQGNEAKPSPYIRAITALEDEIAGIQLLLKDKQNNHGSTPLKLRMRISRLKRAVQLIKEPA